MLCFKAKLPLESTVDLTDWFNDFRVSKKTLEMLHENLEESVLFFMVFMWKSECQEETKRTENRKCSRKITGNSLSLFDLVSVEALNSLTVFKSKNSVDPADISIDGGLVL